jgi:LCP family protein required for cell wall assembly
MVLIQSPAGTALLSLPRDLLIDDPCTGSQLRLNTLLEGCGEAVNGPTLLMLGVAGLIGHEVDHFAMVDLAGFQAAVDAIGGYEICVENAVRDSKSNLELPAGCTMASGEQTLAWLRSRATQELTAEGWRVIPGVSDLARNERQRGFLIDMMGRLSDFTSPQAMAATARTVAPYVTVDSGLGLTDAVDIAWTMRGLGTGDVLELTVPVRFHTTEQGASVLVAEESVSEIVSNFLTSVVAARGVVGAAG